MQYYRSILNIMSAHAHSFLAAHLVVGRDMNGGRLGGCVVMSDGGCEFRGQGVGDGGGETI